MRPPPGRSLLRGTVLPERLVWAGAALFACAHLLWLPGQLEDIDSINFALGVLDYDVAAHQPHPPGYPVLMLLARGVAWLLAPLVGDPLPRATLALAVLSSLAGPIALVALYHVLRLATGADVGGRPAGWDSPPLPTSPSAASPEDAGASRQDGDMGVPRVDVGLGRLAADAERIGPNAERRTLNAEPGTARGQRRTQAPRVADERLTWLALAATALTGASPLFWVTAARPLSDMPGLAAALVCQWLLLRAAQPTATSSAAYIAAVACGVAVGLRSQVTWLVVPLLIWTWWQVGRRAGSVPLLGVPAAALAGVLTWAIPMVSLSGGEAGYRAALASQAGEDFEGVPMLFLQPGMRRLITALMDSLVTPWASWSLAGVVLALALVGTGVVLVRWQRPHLTWLVLGFAPYTVFHLLFQETETTRYALPLVVPTAVLAAIACAALPRLAATGLTTVAVAAALAVSVQAHRQYVTAGMTVSEVLAAMDDAAERMSTKPPVLMHRRVWAETRRARALEGDPDYLVMDAPRALEWQAAMSFWAQDDAPMWWLVDPRRGDRVAVDPRALSLRMRVAWPEPVASVLGGMRPHPFDWYDVRRPQWVLHRGWGLTPELAGLAEAAREGAATTGSTASVQGWPEGGTLVIGGRRVAPPTASATTLDVTLGDTSASDSMRRQWTWTHRVAVAPGDFVAVLDVPAAPTRDYLPLRVREAAPGDGRILLEQFDAQPRGVPVLALESGWYEPERDVTTGRTWRWVADHSTLRVAGATGDVRLIVEGTWPRHYDESPVLEWYAGGQRLARHDLARPFRVEQRITAELLRAHGGQVSWRVSPSFVAGERTGTSDARRLALEIASLRVEALR